MGDLCITELARRQLEIRHAPSPSLGFLFSKMGSGVTARLIKSLLLCHSPATQDGKRHWQFLCLWHWQGWGFTMWMFMTLAAREHAFPSPNDKWIMARGIGYHHCWKPSSWAMQIKSPGAGSLAGSLCLSELSLLTVLNTGIPSTENSRSQDKMITNLRFCFKKLLDNNTSYMPDTGPSSSFVTIYVMCPGSMISTISSFPF